MAGWRASELIQDSIPDLAKLVAKYGARMRSVVFVRPPDDKTELRRIVAVLSRLKAKRLAITLHATFHDALVLRTLRPLLLRAKALLVVRDLHDFSDDQSRRWFRRFMVVAASTPPIPSIRFQYFPLGLPETRLLRRLARDKPCAHHRLTSLYRFSPDRRVLSILPDEVLAQLEALDLEQEIFSDYELSRIGKLSRLRKLTLRGSRITDVTVRKIGALRNLETIDLRDTAITGSGLSAFRGHRHLLELHLANTSVSDDALIPLRGLHSLRFIGLEERTRVTRRVLDFLRSLPQLEDFSSDFGEIPGFAALRKTLARRRMIRQRRVDDRNRNSREDRSLRILVPSLMPVAAGTRQPPRPPTPPRCKDNQFTAGSEDSQGSVVQCTISTSDNRSLVNLRCAAA